MSIEKKKKLTVNQHQLTLINVERENEEKEVIN